MLRRMRVEELLLLVAVVEGWIDSQGRGRRCFIVRVGHVALVQHCSMALGLLQLVFKVLERLMVR